jgi:hypothetical protein
MTPLLEAADVATAAGKTLDSAELQELQDELDAFQAEVESYLHRRLQRGQITEDVEVTYRGRLNLIGPGLVVSSVKDSDGNDVSWRYDQEYRDGICVTRSLFTGQPRNALYTVTYTAGDANPPREVVKLLKDVAVRALVAGVKISSGAIASLSVEGTSIGYGASKLSPDSDGSFVASELKVLDRWRRRIIR